MLLPTAKTHLQALSANGEVQPQTSWLLHEHHCRLHTFATCRLLSTHPTLKAIGGSLFQTFPSPLLTRNTTPLSIPACMKDKTGDFTLCSLPSSLFDSITVQCSWTHATI